jgi:hypothetical protein
LAAVTAMPLTGEDLLVPLSSPPLIDLEEDKATRAVVFGLLAEMDRKSNSPRECALSLAIQLTGFDDG